MAGRQFSCTRCKGKFHIPGVSDANKVVACPLCGEETRLVPLKGGGKANHEQRNEFNPQGGSLLIAGLILVCVLPWFFKWVVPWGAFVGLALLFTGAKMTRVSVCSKCDGDIKEKNAKRCPHCKAVFVDDPV